MADITIDKLHKEFGLGADKVVALENVNLSISGHAFVSDRRPVGLRQVDAAEHPVRHRRARPAAG